MSIGVWMKTIAKSEFKPKAFEYFRIVESTGEEILITDHGKPVLKISKYSDSDNDILESLKGAVTHYAEPLKPVAVEDWEALS
jgi:prevent-host-death family protein